MKSDFPHPSKQSIDSAITSDSNSHPSGRQSNYLVKNFLIGTVLGTLPVLVLLWLSVWTTHSAQVNPLELVVAVLFPVSCGLLAIAFEDRFINSLSAILDSLPF